MHRSFISLVLVLGNSHEAGEVEAFVEDAGTYLAGTFSDYEIIMVENGSMVDLQRLRLSDTVRQNCYVVSLAHAVPYDLGALAGLERANGDYALIFDTVLRDQLALIEQMFVEAQKGFDIIVLRDRVSSSTSVRRWLFFTLMRRVYPSLDARDRKEAMLSRRALNWIQRYRNRSIFLSEVLASSGYRMAPIELVKPAPVRKRSSEHRDRLAWATLTRATELPLQAATLTSLLLILVIAVFSINALLVRLFGFDILGRPETAEPGLTYLVIFIALGFLLTNISLYSILRIIFVINEDVRRDPYYIVEAFRRI